MEMPPHPKVAEWTKLYRWSVGGEEISALHARFVSRRYPRHSHDYFVVGLVESGAQSYTYRGARHITAARQLFVVNPDEVHTGEAASPQGYVYRTLCFGERCIADAFQDLGACVRKLFLNGAVFAEPDVFSAFSQLHMSLAEGAPPVERDVLLYEAVALLFERHGDAARSSRAVGNEREAVMKAKKYIAESFSEDISISQLANLSSLSPFYFARAFKEATGLPPHAYIDGVRLRQARRLLDRSESIASAALAVGYADQSHLTKRFKRVYGITPGQYLRANRSTKTLAT
jgi:AraC-like DNA-binding protein